MNDNLDIILFVYPMVIIIGSVAIYMYLQNKRNKGLMGVIRKVEHVTTNASLPVTKFEIHVSKKGKIKIFFAAFHGHVEGVTNGRGIKFYPSSEFVMTEIIHKQYTDKDGRMSRWTEERKYYNPEWYKFLDEMPRSENNPDHLG